MNAHDASVLEAELDDALSHLDPRRAEAAARRYLAGVHQEHTDESPAQSLWFRAHYLAAQVALAGGHLEEMLRRLRPVLPLVPQLPPPLACHVLLLAAEAETRLGRLPPGRDYLDRALALRVNQERDPTLRLRVLRIRLWLGELSLLTAELTACSWALESDVPNAVLLACEEGRAWHRHGDLARAVACWKRAEQMACDPGIDPLRAEVLLQLGRAAHEYGQLQDALDRYDQALTLVPTASWQWQETSLRRLLLFLDLNQIDQARAGLADLQTQTTLDQLPEEVGLLALAVRGILDDVMVTDQEVRAYAAAARGDWPTARCTYRRLLTREPSPARRARLTLALGMLALAAGDAEEARVCLRQADEAAIAQDLPEVRWRALQALGRLAAECEGDDERARTLFEQALDVLEGQAAQLRQPMVRSRFRQLGSEALQLLLGTACHRRSPEKVFSYQELQRGRLLLELWRAAPGVGNHPSPANQPALEDLDRQLAVLEQQAALVETEPTGDAARAVHHRQLLRQRDRLLDDILRDRGRQGSARLPALATLEELRRQLPRETVYLAPVVLEEELFLLAVRATDAAVIPIPEAGRVRRQTEAVRRCLREELSRFVRLGRAARRDPDECLEDLGNGPLGDTLEQTIKPGERLIWVPDGFLHGIPMQALRRHGRYLIEDHEISQTFQGSLLVHQGRTRSTRRPRRGPALVVTEDPAVLPQAPREAAGVAAAFGRSRTYQGPSAERRALRPLLAQARAAHFACHAYFDAEHPLTACIGLPSGEKWRALEWLDEPIDGLPLVTLSACRSAEVAPLVGGEVFGLVTGLLAGGVRAVVAGLWPVPDHPDIVRLMWLFYRHQMTENAVRALALAQREVLAGAESSPLVWAVFALFGEAVAAASPSRWWAWWHRWRQRRHAARYPA